MDASSRDGTTIAEWPLSQVVYSDRVPTESERGQIINHIRSMEGTQEELEKAVEDARQKARSTRDRNLELRIAKAREGRELINRLKGALSTSRLLPDELVGEVFGYCVGYGSISPWVLARVNHRFRRIVFDTRNLWTAITIPLQMRMKRESFYKFHKSRHHCSSVITLQKPLALSGKAPLNIIIESLTREITTVLVQERERWDTVECYADYSNSTTSNLFQSKIPGMMRKAAFGWAASVPFQWLEVAKPVCLSIHGDTIADGRWWERLQDFSLSRASSWEEPTPESANNLLRALQGIRKQLVRLELIHMPFPTEMPLQFPRLRELHIRDVPGWELIECDGLERLKFRGPPIIDGLQITYPHVRELDISDLYEDYGLAYLDLPELNTLTFEHKQRESILRCPKDICDRVKTVRLCLKSLNSSHLHLVLPDFTSLETLEIYDTPPFVPFFQRFEARHGQPPLCPTLRRLSIDFSELSHMITKDFLAAIFQKVVDSRISSYPLQSLRVEWPVKQVCRFTEFV